MIKKLSILHGLCCRKKLMLQPAMHNAVKFGAVAPFNVQQYAMQRAEGET